MFLILDQGHLFRSATLLLRALLYSPLLSSPLLAHYAALVLHSAHHRFTTLAMPSTSTPKTKLFGYD